VNLAGGWILQTAGGFDLAAGKTLTATQNALISFTTESTLGETFNLSDGADVTNSAAVNVADADPGTLSVSGTGSSYTSTGNTVWGRFGGNANVTFGAAAAGTIAFGGSISHPARNRAPPAPR
jgi:hypothetical protein